MLSDDWVEVVADRAATSRLLVFWEALSRGPRRRNCTALANLARSILAGEERLLDPADAGVGRLAARLGGERVARAYAAALVRGFPPPWEQRLTATARGLQLAGIVLCRSHGDDIERCPCFTGLAETETTDQVTAILAAGTQDWRGLSRFPGLVDLRPPPPHSASRAPAPAGERAPLAGRSSPT